MLVTSHSSPFGGSRRTRTLETLFLLTESHPREIARVLAAPHSSILKTLASLERDGLVAGRSVGRTRLYRLDPRYFAHRELRQYLARLTEPETDLRNAVSALRRRPRRSAKPL